MKTRWGRRLAGSGLIIALIGAKLIEKEYNVGWVLVYIGLPLFLIAIASELISEGTRPNGTN